MDLADYELHLTRAVLQQSQALESLKDAISKTDWHTAWLEAKKLSASANWAFVEAELTAGKCAMLKKGFRREEVTE